ncbi:MAG: hypothetical protein ACWA41_07190 [Putridiphycobacter sp.]
MFDVQELLKNVDLGDVMAKFGLGESEKKKVTQSAVEAVKYRTEKESNRGNSSILENLFSQDKNSADADTVAKKLEGDLAYSLKNKAGMEDGVIDQIKSAVMDKFLGGLMNTGGKGGKSILDGFLSKDLMSKFTGDGKDGGIMDTISGFFGK